MMVPVPDYGGSGYVCSINITAATKVGHAAAKNNGFTNHKTSAYNGVYGYVWVAASLTGKDGLQPLLWLCPNVPMILVCGAVNSKLKDVKYTDTSGTAYYKCTFDYTWKHRAQDNTSNATYNLEVKADNRGSIDPGILSSLQASKYFYVKKENIKFPDYSNPTKVKDPNIPKADTTPTSGGGGNASISGGDMITGSDPVVEEWVDDVNWYNYFVSGGIALEEDDPEDASNRYYNDLASRYGNMLAAPPHYNMDTDPQYMDKWDAGAGRVYRQTVLENPSILSITPGRIKMFPYLIGTKKDGMIEAFIDAVKSNGNNNALVNKLTNGKGGRFSSKMYTFETDLASFANHLNVLCRACAILMGIGNMKFGGTDVSLANFDYAYWSIKKKYTSAVYRNNSDKDNSIFRSFYDVFDNHGSLSSFFKYGENACTINFFMNGAETQVNENIETGVTDGPLQGAISSVNEAAAMINYFTGSGFFSGVSGGTVEDALQAVLGSNSTVRDFINIGKNFLNGGKMVLPKMLESTSYGKSVTCNLKFTSLYGSRYSVFLRCIVPICHLLALSLPRQLSDNMYAMPPIVRAQQLGAFNMDVGVISNISITRGGSDDTAYTIDGLSTEWDVSLTLTPLMDILMITPASSPVLFMRNDALLDYLGNYCAFDILANNAQTKGNMLKQLIINKWFKDYSYSLTYKIMDKAYQWFSPIMNVALGRF